MSNNKKDLAKIKHHLWTVAKDKGLLHFGRLKVGKTFKDKKKVVDQRKEEYNNLFTGA
jgi:hypothetical protein